MLNPEKINLQPTLQNNLVIASPLLEIHFEELFTAAADPLIWEQHPNPNRWQKKSLKIIS
jgi:hypothetical protein